MRWFYTRGQCGGDIRKIWIGQEPPDRKQEGREITFYSHARCHCLLTVISFEQFEVIAKVPQLRPDTCLEIPPLIVR